MLFYSNLNSLASRTEDFSCIFRNVLNTDSCRHSLLPPSRPPAVISRLRSSQTFPKSILAHTATVLSYIMALIITSIKPIIQVILPLSVLILVLLLVSFITVMLHLGYLISLTHLCFIAFYHCISY